MSDLSLPAPRSSSTSPQPSSPASSSSQAANPPSDASSSSENHESIQFLVHSQQSVSNGELPRLSNGRADKKARKRTSPQDQAILEAEYKKNPKPDKVARIEIVKQVKLTEKEVQIWFQNRRQTTRRKSRPLLPHEIEAFGLGGMAALLATSSSTGDGHAALNSSQQSHDFTSSPTESPAPLDLAQASTPSQAVNTQVSSTTSSTSPESLPASAHLPATLEGERGVELATSSFVLQGSQMTRSENTSFTFSQENSPPMPSTLGYISNRRHAHNSSFGHQTSPPIPALEAFMNESTNNVAPTEAKPSSEQNTSSSSQVRLSLGLDGRAELVSGIPSPPRPASANNSKIPRRNKRLQRSQSAIPLSLTSASSNPFSKPPAMPMGRSRDSRTWELCCDSSARDELMTQAENESSGSAVAAISLLRSTSASTSAALKSNSNKRNAAPLKRTTTGSTVDSKHAHHHTGKKARLSRAASSLARLQGTTTHDRTGLVDQASTTDDIIKKPKDGGGLLRSPSGDSDKENWEPISAGVIPTGNSTARRQPLPSTAGVRRARTQQQHQSQNSTRRVLGDNNAVPTLAVDFGKAPSSSTGTSNHQYHQQKRSHNAASKTALPPAPAIFEDNSEAEEGDYNCSKAAVDPEVERFMRGEVSPSKKGDLDCIQGLLSLSQGNWR